MQTATASQTESTTYAELCHQYWVEHTTPSSDDDENNDSPPVIDGKAVVSILPGWFVSEDDFTSEFPTISDPEAAAISFIDDYPRDNDSETFWVNLKVFRCATVRANDGRKITLEFGAHYHHMAVSPPEPKCDSPKGHKWRSPLAIVGGIKENPGCWGRGGGVYIIQVCARCGRFSLTDTWAQCPETGAEGLTAVSYDEPTEESLAWVRKRKKKKARQKANAQ